MATVLSAYAACEIHLMDIIVGRSTLNQATQDGLTPASMTKAWSQSVEEVGGMSRTKEILKECKALGHWIAPELWERIVKLGKHKNDFAHFQPYGPTEFFSIDDSTVGGKMEASILLREETRREYAEAAIRTMLDLWFAPSVSFSPGNPPPDDWHSRTR